MLVTDHINGSFTKDSLFRIRGNKLEYNGDGGLCEDRNIVVFSSESKPTQSCYCNFHLKKKEVIKFKVYYDSGFEDIINSGQFEDQINILNNVHNVFENGYSFVINGQQKIEDFKLTSSNGDRIFHELNSDNIIDKSISWHLFLLSKENYFVDATAFHTVSNNHHLIFGNKLIANEPIALLHEFMHGFKGHVDIEKDDSTINDPQEAIKNIMYNYDLPKNPRYSYYQNMMANEISGSNFLGINAFPYDDHLGALDIENINISPNQMSKSLLTGQVLNGQKKLDVLLDNPVESYLFSLDKKLPKELLNRNNIDLLNNYISDDQSRFYIDMYRSMLEDQAKFLSIYGLKNEEIYVESRIKSHLNERSRKIVVWAATFEVNNNYLVSSISSLSTGNRAYYENYKNLLLYSKSLEL